jgi:hypothetical protein
VKHYNNARPSILHTVQILLPVTFGWTLLSQNASGLTIWKPHGRWKGCISVYEHHSTKRS